MKKLLVSACLLGAPCRYDGKSKPLSAISKLAKHYELIPICPEVMGGLSTPRLPGEIQEGRVIRQDGVDITAYYQKGAAATLKIAKDQGCTLALLKEKSPSCGAGLIHNGKFDGGMVEGFGIAAELLLQNGIAVFGESEVEKLLIGANFMRNTQQDCDNM